MLFDPAADHSPVLPREGRPAKRSRVAASLGIKRLLFERGYHGSLGNATIVLSGGDGSVFTGWIADCSPVTAADRLRCRAPDGCAQLRLDGRSYCRRHHALFHVPFPPPSGRLLTITSAANRKRERTAPRLDLLKGM